MQGRDAPVEDLDVAIVGAGPVGATLAALASSAGLSIALFEARPAPASDARTLALSDASRTLLEEAGAWPAEVATPLTSIHVSQRGGPGRTLITASEQGLPALGYTLPFARLQQSLDARIAACGIPIRYGHACEDIALAPDAAMLRFASGVQARARLLVLADGGANAKRIPGIAFHEKDYEQAAVVGLVECDRPHAGRAYERFTPEGPVALLPVAQGFALVWTSSPDESARRLAMDDASFLAELQDCFGDRAGRFVSVTGRASFPLRLRAVNSPIALRTAFVGNAAQALHPIAGQGLNLGLRDAASLGALLSHARREAIGGHEMLEAYRASRRKDSSRGIAFTDFLVSAFADGRRIPMWGRGLGLAVLDLFPPARRLLAERMIHGAPVQ
jgi:2-octaprenyl-6-methoxyphenol hydroxylase